VNTDVSRRLRRRDDWSTAWSDEEYGEERRLDGKITWSEAFHVITQWNSEFGVPSCENISYFVDHNPCHVFQFKNARNVLPLDSPSPEVQYLPAAYHIVLSFISLSGICAVIIVMVMTFLYRHRRMVG